MIFFFKNVFFFFLLFGYLLLESISADCEKQAVDGPYTLALVFIRKGDDACK